MVLNAGRVVKDARGCRTFDARRIYILWKELTRLGIELLCVFRVS